ncbi:MAG: 50S ribosomal protein L4 [Candidatus Saccharibacteria bacterium]
MKAITYTRTGSKAAETTLAKSVFEVEISNDLLKQSVVRANANLRQGNAKTLTRGEVSGGGRKPWRQKGTGRARFGSTRVNIWRHGGVAHGPTGLQNYEKDMPTSMVRASIKMALASKTAVIKVIDKFIVAEPKTKLADALLGKLEATGRVMLITSEVDGKFVLAASNLPGVMVVDYKLIRTYDILNADVIIIEKPALEGLEKWLGGKK